MRENEPRPDSHGPEAAPASGETDNVLVVLRQSEVRKMSSKTYEALMNIAKAAQRALAATEAAKGGEG